MLHISASTSEPSPWVTHTTIWRKRPTTAADRPFIRLAPLPGLPQLGGKPCGDATPSFRELTSSQTVQATMQDAYTSLQHRHLVTQCTGSSSTYQQVHSSQFHHERRDNVAHMGGPQCYQSEGSVLLGPTEQLLYKAFSLRLRNVADLITIEN